MIRCRIVGIQKSLLIVAVESSVSSKNGSESSNLLRETKKQVRVRFAFLHLLPILQT
ncbi:hypothetical protein RHGRI_023714 [Rhododendron griersonianum]|uniref:Uncharacterized protein n=1 Tax=Rhododendron griersonianum TaxID=479676 RepID=A0AAV6J693_9ERIC|nr:hypothetical protein RHGRI_023714 [Rhododendron griersonianum]